MAFPEASANGDRQVTLNARMRGSATGHSDRMEAIELIAQWLSVFPLKEFDERHRSGERDVHGRSLAQGCTVLYPWVHRSVLDFCHRRQVGRTPSTTQRLDQCHAGDKSILLYGERRLLVGQQNLLLGNHGSINNRPRLVFV